MILKSMLNNKSNNKMKLCQVKGRDEEHNISLYLINALRGEYTSVCILTINFPEIRMEALRCIINLF